MDESREVTLMDDSYRQRLKIGIHEFEAQGPVNVVQEQVKRFLDLIASLPAEQVLPASREPDVPTTVSEVLIPTPTSSRNTISIPAIDLRLDKIMKVAERIVSLTVRPKNPDDAALLLLYGQKMLRENDSVTGAEIMGGITATGGLSMDRVDRLLEKLARDGDVIVVGEHRSKRYRLTNSGLNKVRHVAGELVATVA
jgi:hypothetical protein